MTAERAKQVREWGRGFEVPPNSVMIDVETLGTDPDKSPLIQIGACTFDDSFTTGREFRMALTIPPDREVNPETEAWWRRTDAPLLDALLAEAVDHVHVLESLRSWLPTRPSLWAWPATFDLFFVFSYARKYHRPLMSRFHPSLFMDCRSWVAGARGKLVTAEECRGIWERQPPFAGQVHDGLHDSKTQVWYLGQLAELVRRREQDQFLNFGGAT